MAHLIEHQRGAITIDLEGSAQTSRDLQRSYFKLRNAVLVEEVQIWNVGGTSVRVSRLVLRRLHWAVSAWQLTDVQRAPAEPRAGAG